MIVNIYKEEEVFFHILSKGNSYNPSNPFRIFFVNKDSINDYTVTPHVIDKDRYFLKYYFDGSEYFVDIDHKAAEAILNNYRVEILED